MSVLSERLKALREDNDMKQDVLAEMLGVSRSNISKYENEGIPNPPYEILIKYADIFDTTVDFLVGRVDEKNLKMSSTEKLKISHDKNTTFSKEELLDLEKALKIILNKK